MIALLYSVALLNVGVSTSGGEETTSTLPVPDPPETQILDRMEWLSESRRLTIDAELSRIHEDHGIDLYVVVWDRRLPDGEGAEEFARRIGTSWSRGPVWGLVFLTPGSISTPYVVTGGANLKNEDSRHLHAAAVYSREFGARAWNDQERLQQTALTLAEELVFAAHAIVPAAAGSSGAVTVVPPAGERRSGLPLPVFVAAGGLGLVLLLVIVHAVRRGKGEAAPEAAPEPEPPGAEPLAGPVVRTFELPATQPSLGAPWSSGASLIVTVPGTANR